MGFRVLRCPAARMRPAHMTRRCEAAKTEPFSDPLPKFRHDIPLYWQIASAYRRSSPRPRPRPLHRRPRSRKMRCAFSWCARLMAQPGSSASTSPPPRRCPACIWSSTGEDPDVAALGSIQSKVKRKAPDGSPNFEPPYLPLARGRALFVGDAVAAVFAEDARSGQGCRRTDRHRMGGLAGCHRDTGRGRSRRAAGVAAGAQQHLLPL